MKFKNILLSVMALAGLAQAGEPCTQTTTTETCDSYRMFYDGPLNIPGEDAPDFKKKLFDATGTGFFFELYGAHWDIDHQGGNYESTCNLALLLTQIDQRLIRDAVNGGTWLSVSGCGSWGLDHDSAKKDLFYDGGLGIGTGQHTDSVGPAGYYILNATLRQYFNNKRTCLNAGVIWMSLYFDRIGHARFVNDAFEKSPVLPMYYGTPGAVIQHEIDPNNFVTAAVIGTGLGLGDNPFNLDNTNGWAVVTEYGRHFADGKGTWRVAPFFCSMDTPGYSGGDEDHNSAGIMTGVEYNVSDRVKVYARLACASSEHQRARKEAMVGTTLRVVPSRPQDYFGACFGVYKCANTASDPLVNAYEKVLEFTYHYELNKYISIAPFYQLYIDPAYRNVSTVSATGLQAHVEF